MKRSPLILRLHPVILGCCLLVSHSIQAQELQFPNAGFEEGEASWTWGDEDQRLNFSRVSTDAAHTGKNGLQVIKEGDNGGSSVLSPLIAVEAGKKYTVNYWLRCNQPGAAAIYIHFYDFKKNRIPLSIADSELVNPISSGSLEWVQETISVTVPQGAKSLQIWIHAATKGTVGFDIDDFSISKASSAAVSSRYSEKLKEIESTLAEKPSGLGRPISDRAFWQMMSKQPAFSGIIEKAEKELVTSLPSLSDTVYLEFSKTGNRANYDAAYSRWRERLRLAVLAECLENKGRFLQDIEKTIMSLAGLKTWVGSAHDSSLENFKGLRTDIDLYAGITASSLAAADWLLQDNLKPQTRQLVRSEINKRIFAPYLESVRQDRTDGVIGWWRHCRNNWNASCHANVTGTALMLVESPAERAEFIFAAITGIKHYLDGITDEGFSSEGLAYGQRAFGDYEILAETILKATRQSVNLYANEKAFNLSRFPLRMEILPGVFPAFGDCWTGISLQRWIFDIASHRYGFGLERFDSSEIKDLGDNLYATAVVINLDRSEKPVYTSKTEAGDTGALRDWFAKSDILVCRPPNRRQDALGLAIKAGNNAVNDGHEHTDLGSFVIARGKRLLVIDPGTPIYKAGTFGPRRFENPVVNSYGHSVPVVAGQLQKNNYRGSSLVINKTFSDASDSVTLDLKNCYEVGELQKLVREIRYDRHDQGAVTVTDQVRFATPQDLSIPLLTLSEWRQTNQNTLEIFQGPDAVLVSIDTGGVPFSIKETVIPESPNPRRIEINLTKIIEASVTVKITPRD